MPPKSAVRALPAQPPLISLLTSAERIPEQDMRWEAGVIYEPEFCGTDGSGSFDPCLTDDRTFVFTPSFQEVEPFGVWAGNSCGSFGYARREWKQRAERKLEACQSNIIERELWRGELARAATPTVWPNRYFTESTATEVTGSPTTPLNALACLEQALATCNCGAQGMIHAMPQIVTHWIASNLVHREGKKLLTELGTIVVPGSGYDGSGPATTDDGPPVAAADGAIWAYATSMVHYRLGPIQVVPDDISQTLDRENNTITFWAQRIVEVGFDCCLFAASLDVDLCENVS